jgi:voltage-gated potassium channel
MLHPSPDSASALRHLGLGLQLVSPSSTHAVRIEKRWRIPTLIAQLATVPAFYLDMLREADTRLATATYLVAAVMLVVALVRTARATGHAAAHVRANWLDVLLATGLFAAALAPDSRSSEWALLLRLAVGFLSLLRMVWCLQHLFTRGGTIYLIGLALLVLLMCGVGFWWLEPTTPTLPAGLWLAFTTAATVGYGDVVPTTTASKVFAVFVVIFGFGVLTIVTASIATTWIETEERRIERELMRDLHQQIAVIKSELVALRSEARSAAQLQVNAREAAETLRQIDAARRDALSGK